MAYFPLSGLPWQLSKDGDSLAAGYYLKFYLADTTTPVSMATDGTGDTLLVKAQLNSLGIPVTNILAVTTDKSATFQTALAVRSAVASDKLA